MKTIIASALAAVTLAGGLAVAGEASAQRYGGGYYDRHHDRGHRHHRRDNDGAALALGVIAGAALLGNGHVYVNQGYYGPRRGYYGPRRGYYGRNYHARRCWTQSYWDPYYGRVHRRVCR